MAEKNLVRRAASARRVSHELDTLYAEGARVALRCREARRVLDEARAGLAETPVRKPGNSYKLARFAVSRKRDAA